MGLATNCCSCDSLLAGCDDELANPRVTDALGSAVVIQHVLAFNTEPRLEAACWVIYAGMDDLGVPGAGGCTKAGLLF